MEEVIGPEGTGCLTDSGEWLLNPSIYPRIKKVFFTSDVSVFRAADVNS